MPEERAIADLIARLDRIEALVISRFPHIPIPDPPPDDWGRWVTWRPQRIPWPFPEPGDPGPIDISRFSHAQLQLSLETIKAQRIRLDGMEKMINQQLKEVAR